MAPGGREVARDLVAPGSEEGVLGQGHQLEVGEAEPLAVLHQLRRGFAIAEGTIAFFGDPHPRAQVNFVGAHRTPRRIELGSLGHPAAVVPDVRRPGHDGRRGGRQLGASRHRIRLEAQPALLRLDLELVERAFLDPGHEELPDPRGAQRAHGQGATIPTVEVRDDAHAPGVRRPDRKGGACLAVDGSQIRSEHRPQLAVVALAEQMKVELAEGRGKAIGIAAFPAVAVGEVEAESVRDGQARIRKECGEDAVAQRRQLHGAPASQETLGARCIRMKRAHDDPRAAADGRRMRPQKAVRFVVIAVQEQLQVVSGALELGDEVIFDARTRLIGHHTSGPTTTARCSRRELCAGLAEANRGLDRCCVPTSRGPHFGRRAALGLLLACSPCRRALGQRRKDQFA